MTTISAVGSASVTTDKANAAATKAADQLAADQRAKAADAIIKKDQEAVSQATAAVEAAELAVKAEQAAGRGGIDVVT